MPVLKRCFVILYKEQEARCTKSIAIKSTETLLQLYIAFQHRHEIHLCIKKLSIYLKMMSTIENRAPSSCPGLHSTCGITLVQYTTRKYIKKPSYKYKSTGDFSTRCPREAIIGRCWLFVVKLPWFRLDWIGQRPSAQCKILVYFLSANCAFAE